MAIANETEEAKKARLAAEEAAKNAVTTSGSNATNTLVDTAKDLTKKAGNVASDAGNWFSDMFNNGSKGLKEFFKNTSGWGVAGIAGGALLAWTIGEAFGGGGLFGMVVSLMLMPFLAILGRDFAQNNLAPAVAQANGQSPQRTQHVSLVQQPEINTADTQAIAEAARRQAAEAAKGNPGTLDPSTLPPLLPAPVNNPSRART